MSFFVTQKKCRVDSCKHFTENAEKQSFSNRAEKQSSDLDLDLGVKVPTVSRQ